MKKGILVTGLAIALVSIASVASAQGVFFVQNNRTGVHVAAPTATLDVFGAAGTEGTGNSVVKLSRAGALAFQLQDTTAGGTFWNFSAALVGEEFRISRSATGGTEFKVASNGDVTARGNFISGSTTLNVPDFVFEDDYELMPLSEVKAFIEREQHLPDVPSAEEINAGSLNMTEMQMKLLQKVEELTLYTLEQQKTIENLQSRLDSIE